MRWENLYPRDMPHGTTLAATGQVLSKGMFAASKELTVSKPKETEMNGEVREASLEWFCCFGF